MPGGDWPDSVPVLVGDDVLVSDSLWEDGDRRTLGTWVTLAFAEPAHRDRVLEVLTETLGEALGRSRPVHYFEVSFPGDGVTRDPKATSAVMARAWNAAMRRLGYNATQPKEPKPKEPKPKEKKPPKIPDDVDFFE